MKILGKPHEMLRRMPEKDLMLVLSLVVGILCGLAAVILSNTVEWIHHGLTAWFRGSRFNYLYLIYPGLGMIISMLLLKYVIKDNIGHGVTKVLVAISKNESRIRPHNMWSSLLTSSVTIGFGGSVGAEAPIVYTGAAIGSNVAKAMGLSYRNMTTLLGCGAAGAVAGIFKAPLAGVLFTLEILLFNISMSSIMPLLLSTVSATVISYIFMGDSFAFACTTSPFVMRNIPFYILLGVVCGGCSLFFQNTTLALEDRLAKIGNPYVRWALCAGCLGVLIFLFPPLYGEGYTDLHPLLNGIEPSYDGQTILAGMLHRPWLVPLFFFLVMVLKVFSMIMTNSGGGVGGTFGPTLFVGAMTGFVLARTINLILAGTNLTVPEQNFVLVGMAGLMAGVMQAPMTAIFLIAEVTGGYDLFLPLIICSTVSFGVVRIKEKYSIYTKRIANRGELLTHDNDKSILTLMHTRDLIRDKYPKIQMDASLGDIMDIVSTSTVAVFPVFDGNGRFQGVLEMDDIRKHMFDQSKFDSIHVYNLMHSAPASVYEDEPMEEVMKKFEKTDAWRLPVFDRERNYLGFISKSRILSAYRSELQELSQD